MPTCPLEAAEQRALIQWSQHNTITSKYLFAIPNGGFRNAREARNLKLQGVKAGVSDLFLAYPVPPKHGLWIELKRCSKYVVSEAQRKFIELMRSVGYAAEIAVGWEEAKNIILDYLSSSDSQRPPL